jgi:hypothetical protein
MQLEKPEAKFSSDWDKSLLLVGSLKKKSKM